MPTVCSPPSSGCPAEAVGTVDLDAELALAARLADLADSITRPAFAQRAFSVSRKADATEVTDIDRACEAALAGVLGAERPDDGVFGEEHGHQGAGEATATWIIDPIDGTSGFVRGLPIWGTLIALVVDGHPVVATVSAPALDRRWWAHRGGGAFVNGQRCRVSAVSSLHEAQVSVTINRGWDEVGLVDALTSIALDARRARSLGDFWQHMLVAEGALDVAIDAVGVAEHDVAAVRLIVEEAGGTFTDREGVRAHDRGTAISTNGLLHDEVLRRLASASRPAR